MARFALTSPRDGVAFADTLSEFSDDQLLALLQARPDLANPAPTDFASLAARASIWGSISTCLGLLNRASRQLLDALCLLPQPTTVTALARLLGADVDPADLETALARLANMALIFRAGESLTAHPTIKSLPNPAGLGPPLGLALAGQQHSVLTATIRRIGGQPGRTKTDTVAALSKILSDPAQVARILADAPAAAHELVTRLSEHAVGTVSAGTHYIKPETPLGWLAQRGFIFATDWTTIMMPREVGLAVRGGHLFPDFDLRGPQVTWRPVDGAAVDRACTETALRVVADISTILDGWDAAPPKLLKAGGLGVRDLRRAAAAVGRSESDTACLIELAAIAGLAGWEWDLGIAAPCPAYDDWVELPLVDRWLGLVTSWLAAHQHISLAGATGSNGKPIPPLLPPTTEYPARYRRRLVLAALLKGDGGQAADPASLSRRVIWDAPGAWNGGPAHGPTVVSWVLEEAAMLGVCAFGAVSTLGRAVVTGRLDAATTLLGAHAPRITSEIVIQADLTAVATGPLPTSIRSELELLADLESSGAATVYRFSEQSLRRAYDEGRSAEEILAFLESRATKGVPQPLAYLVEDVGRRHGRVRTGSAASYLRSDDPSLLSEILLNRRHAKLELHQLAPTVLVSSADAEVVTTTLRASGYLPAEEDVDGSLLVRRREVARADEGHGPSSALSFDADLGELARRRAAELTHMLAHPSALPASFPFTGSPLPKQEELERVIRQLRAPGPTNSSGDQPRGVRAQPLNGFDGNEAPDSTGTLFLPELLDGPSERPFGIVRTFDAIFELLELSLEQDWYLRLDYTNGQGRSQQINARVFDIDDFQVSVGTMPGYGTRTFAVTEINWARVLTEAEEKAL